jgi:hypothetical protein
MSQDAYARHQARECKIWHLFNYSYPFNDAETADRITIFGLYANAYLNGHKYLNEIEDEELANLLTDYNSKIAELTTQQQIVVADIVSKRYLAGVDKLIHDQKMITKQAEIDNEDALMDAKIAALAADRVALSTMAAKVSAETTKNEARITELEAYIEQEGINLSLADIEIAEKEIALAKLGNEKLNTENEILKIQIETVETAQELLEIDLKISKLLVEIAQTDREIAKIGLLDSELQLEQAKTDLEESGIPLSSARIDLARAKYTDANAELAYINSLINIESTLLTKKMELMDSKQTVRMNEIDLRSALREMENDKQSDLSDAEVTEATLDQASQVVIDDAHIEAIEAGGSAAWDITYAKIQAAIKKAAAAITTQLTHTIKKSTAT